MNNFCLVYKPIYVSAEDVFTDETAEVILENNIYWRRKCK